MSLLINITVHVGNHRCFSDPDPRLCCVCTQFNFLKLQNATNSEAIDSFFFQNVNCNTLVWLIKILNVDFRIFKWRVFICKRFQQ